MGLGDTVAVEENDPQRWLVEGVRALKAGDRAQARRFLLRVVEADERNELGWLWLSGAVAGRDERRLCLENVLALNPDNEKARRALARLGPAPDTPLISTAPRRAPPLSLAAAVLYPAPADEEEDQQPVRPPDPAPPVIEYQSATQYDDIWTNDRDICAYCAHEVAFDANRCQHCRQKLTASYFRYPRPSSNLHIFWAMVLSVAQFFTFQTAIIFPALKMEGQIWYGTLALALFVLPIGIIKRQTWAFVTSLIVLFVVLITTLNIFLGTPLHAALMHDSLPAFTQNDFLSRVLANLLTPAALLSASIALIFAIFMAGADFDRIQTRHIARVDKGLHEGHHYYTRGEQYAQKGMWANAVLHWQRAAGREPHRINYQRSLAEAYARLGFYVRSLDMLQSAHKLAADPEVQSELSQMMARVTQEMTQGQGSAAGEVKQEP